MTLLELPNGKGYNFEISSDTKYYLDGTYTNVAIGICSNLNGNPTLFREIEEGDCYYGIMLPNIEGKVKIIKIIE